MNDKHECCAEVTTTIETLQRILLNRLMLQERLLFVWTSTCVMDLLFLDHYSVLCITTECNIASLTHFPKTDSILEKNNNLYALTKNAMKSLLEVSLFPSCPCHHFAYRGRQQRVRTMKY